MERWQGKVAIVTGASEGIGAEIARKLAENGIIVVPVARNLEKTKKWVEEWNVAHSGEIHPLKCDICQESDIKSVIEWVEEKFGQLHILVNNAGTCPAATLYDGSTADFKQTLDVNVLGLTIMTRETVKLMRKHNIDGHILHINSTSGQSIVDEPGGYYMYAASKHAVRVLTEGLRRELRDLGTKIRVTSVSPGLVKTNIFANSGAEQELNNSLFTENPYLETQDIASAVIYALGAPAHVQVHELTVMSVGEKW